MSTQAQKQWQGQMILSMLSFSTGLPRPPALPLPDPNHFLNPHSYSGSPIPIHSHPLPPKDGNVKDGNVKANAMPTHPIAFPGPEENHEGKKIPSKEFEGKKFSVTPLLLKNS